MEDINMSPNGILQVFFVGILSSVTSFELMKRKENVNNRS